MILLSGITDLLEGRRRQEFSTTLRKIRVHTEIRGNDLVNAAAELAATQYDSLPKSQIKAKSNCRGGSTTPHILGYEHRETTATPSIVGDGYTYGYATPSVVVNSREGETLDARVHATIQTTPT